jgi:hypothetical protein
LPFTKRIAGGDLARGSCRLLKRRFALLFVKKLENPCFLVNNRGGASSPDRVIAIPGFSIVHCIPGIIFLFTALHGKEKAADFDRVDNSRQVMNVGLEFSFTDAG